jgi:hypothetical protein
MIGRIMRKTNPQQIACGERDIEQREVFGNGGGGQS